MWSLVLVIEVRAAYVSRTPHIPSIAYVLWTQRDETKIRTSTFREWAHHHHMHTITTVTLCVCVGRSRTIVQITCVYILQQQCMYRHGCARLVTSRFVAWVRIWCSMCYLKYHVCVHSMHTTLHAMIVYSPLLRPLSLSLGSHRRVLSLTPPHFPSANLPLHRDKVHSSRFSLSATRQNTAVYSPTRVFYCWAHSEITPEVRRHSPASHATFFEDIHHDHFNHGGFLRTQTDHITKWEKCVRSMT